MKKRCPKCGEPYIEGKNIRPHVCRPSKLKREAQSVTSEDVGAVEELIDIGTVVSDTERQRNEERAKEIFPPVTGDVTEDDKLTKSFEGEGGSFSGGGSSGTWDGPSSSSSSDSGGDSGSSDSGSSSSGGGD